MKLICEFIFWLTGWKTKGELPKLDKYVLIAAPHTSTWDVPIGICGRYLFDMPCSFFGKQEIFKPPFGFIFRAFGGIPVDRSSSHNMVDQAVELFKTREKFYLAISPEGTRKYAPKWKTGFYYIALKAQVPIVLVYFDFEQKVLGIGPSFYPTGDVDKDIESIKDFYRPIKGRHPERGVI